MSISDLISAAEAAAVLGVDRSTISRWVERGRLTPALKLPGSRGAYLFERQVIEAARSAESTTEGVQR